MKYIKLFEEFLNERKTLGILNENAMIHSPLYQFMTTRSTRRTCSTK